MASHIGKLPIAIPAGVEVKIEGQNFSAKGAKGSDSYVVPEGITAGQVEELSKYNGKFVTATHVAVGEMAAEIFKGDKAAESIEAEVGYFGKNDSISINVARTKTFQNHLAKDPSDKEVVKHLVMQTTVSSSSVKGNGLKAVRDTMSEEFAGMFSK